MRFTYSDRIKDFPTELSRRAWPHSHRGDAAPIATRWKPCSARRLRPGGEVDHTDGVRITFDSGEIAHLRPSGNAPELRAYTEAGSAERAREMNAICMEILNGWRAASSKRTGA
jgi:phosphomannomutase